MSRKIWNLASDVKMSIVDDSEDAESSEEEWSVETILKKRIDSATGGAKYLLKWKGYPPEFNTWETQEDLDCTEMIAAFERVISQPNLAGTEPEVTADIFILDENPSLSTLMITDEDVDLDFTPVILDEEFQAEDALHGPPDDDGVDDGPGDNTVGGAELTSDEEMMNHSDQLGIVDEDQPSRNKSRRCKVQTTQVISDLLRNDDDDENDEDSPTIESDSDADDTSERELEPKIEKKRDDRNGGGMSSNPSTNVQIEDDKHIDSVCGKQVGSEGLTFACETCHKTFSAKKYLYAHRKRVHLKELRHKCQKCGKGFYRPCNLKLHHQKRIPCTELNKKRKYQCHICKYGFTTKGSLACHGRQVHNGEKRTKCPHPKCQYQYFSKTKLQSHLKIYHPPDEKEISCTICNQKFSSVKEKLAHIRSTHTCRFCIKSFQNKADLDEHQTTNHTGDRAYVCTNCGNRFARKKALRRHLRETTCNPDKDEMEEARRKACDYKKEWLAKRKL